MFHRIYSRFGNPNKDYEQRQKELEEAITGKPKKKKQKKMKTLHYLGEEISKYKTKDERNDVRGFLKEKAIKLNWHTVELINKDTRPREQTLPQCSIFYQVRKHWVGYSKVAGQQIPFLVAHAVIPEDYLNEEGEIFPKSFF